MSDRPTNKQIKLWVNEKFTKKQIEIYSLIHPDLGGMSIKSASGVLGITIRSAERRLAHMREIYPQAFRYEDLCTDEQQLIADSDKIEKEMSNLGNIIGRTKQLAKRYKVPFELDNEDFLEIIRQPCMVCDREGTRDGITEDGRHFKYNMIILRSLPTGFTYVNAYPICTHCKDNQSWRNLQRFKRMGF